MTGTKNQDVTIIPDMRIPLSDDTVLSARVWMPETAHSTPLPAILEYLPYRKTDGTAARDHAMHLHFAEHGYVSMRVDRRGCGDSTGLFDDEYSLEEIDDGVEIINWIASQSWCSGAVGIQGISWGGFNGLQIAARAPDALKAVITIGSTVDRFADDIHYKGGIQLGENIGWAATAMSWLSTPPDPDLVGENWRDIWLERLKNTPNLAKKWITHSNRDAYWEHGSVCEDYSSIKATTLAIGGLQDGYRNTMAHLTENLSAPVQGIAGPWGHKYPHVSPISPAIDYFGIALRWWDRWLKNIDNGADQDPAYRAYVMDSVPPHPSLDHRPGTWLAFDQWPSPDITQTTLSLAAHCLQDQAAAFDIEVTGDLACGRNSGEYFPFGFGPGELPDNQHHDDTISSCFDSTPLDQDWTLLGSPSATLTVASDQPHAQIILRLCDVAPDGTSALISLGLLNLRHRDGFDNACDLAPDQPYQVTITLDHCAYRLPAGHKLRLSISNSYWPYCWPEGRAFSLRLTAGTLSLPRYSGSPTPKTCSFAAPTQTKARPYKTLQSPTEMKTREISDETGKITLNIAGNHGIVQDLENGLTIHSAMSETWSITPNDPASAYVEMTWDRTLGRSETDIPFDVRTQTVARMWGQKDHFVVHQTLKAWDGDTLVHETIFQDKIRRAPDEKSAQTNE